MPLWLPLWGKPPPNLPLGGKPPPNLPLGGGKRLKIKVCLLLPSPFGEGSGVRPSSNFSASKASDNFF